MSTKRPTPCGVRLPVPPEWDAAIAEFLHDRRALGRARTSLKTWQSNLEHAARQLPGGPWDQTRATIRDYFAAHDWMPDTRRGRKNVLYAFFEFGRLNEKIERNPLEGFGSFPAGKPHPNPVPEAVYLAALSAAPPRERLMLRMGHEMGLRRAEIAGLHTRDFWQDFDGGWVVDIHGKGLKTRTLPVPDSIALEVGRLDPGFVFPGKRDGHLSPEYVGRRLAALLPGAFHTHNLRHSYATRLYDDTGDILLVQEALGHDSPKTTEMYVRTDNRRRIRESQARMSRPHALRGVA